MHILHLIHQFPPHHIGGTERYTQGLVKTQRQDGHETTIFVPTPTNLPPDLRHRSSRPYYCAEEADGMIARVYIGPRSPAQSFQDSLFGNASIENGLSQLLEDLKPDVVHIQHLMGYPLAAVARILGRLTIPYIITLHDFWWVCANAQLVTNYDDSICDGPNLYLNCARCVVARSGRPMLHAAVPVIPPFLFRRQQLLTSILEGASQLVTPTHFVADWYSKQFDGKFQPHAIPNGIEPITFDQSDDSPKDDEPAGARSLHILFLGGLARQKGGHILLDAVRGLDAIFVTIAGAPSPEPAYDRLLLDNLPPNAIYIGLQSKENIQKLLFAADFLAVPSIWYETFGMVISEAFEMGVPVVASNLGALAERVEHDVNGWLVAPNDVSAWRIALRTLSKFKQEHQLDRFQTPSVTLLEDHHEAIMRIYSSLTVK